MKKISLLLTAAMFTTAVFAQQEPEEEVERKGIFKKENLFTGGTANVSFFNGSTVLGVAPFFGYSINRFVDVAASINFNYISQRDYNIVGDKVRQTVLGPGAFVRLYPVNFFFAQAQYEYNTIKLRYIPLSGSGYSAESIRLNASSVLVGGGYCSGRQGVGNTFYYLSILWDVTKNENSPYVDVVPVNNNTGFQKRAIPIVRAGFQIALFRGRNRRF